MYSKNHYEQVLRTKLNDVAFTEYYKKAKQSSDFRHTKPMTLYTRSKPENQMVILEVYLSDDLQTLSVYEKVPKTGESDLISHYDLSYFRSSKRSEAETSPKKTMATTTKRPATTEPKSTEKKTVRRGRPRTKKTDK